MKYEVIYPFRDLQNKTEASPDGVIYKVGDSYPKGDYEPSEARVNELAGADNAIGKALIVAGEEVAADEPVKEVPAYDEITKKDIIALLKEAGIEHNENSDKKDLYPLLLGSD